MTGHSVHAGRPFAGETPEQRVERFSRQLVLRDVGAAGQRRWLASRVTIEGGGLAARAASMWLGAAGVAGGGGVLKLEDGPDALGSLVAGVETARGVLLGLLRGGPSTVVEARAAPSGCGGRRVLVVGAGGLGCPALLGLAAAGASFVRLVDDDVVERSNLPRQVLHREEDIGRPKVDSAVDGLRRWTDRMPGAAVEVEARRERFGTGNAARLLDGVDLVLDASDNFPTKYRVNAAALAAGIPAVIGGALRMDGQVFGAAPGGACYRCVFAHSPEPGAAPTCSSVGILGPVVGAVGLRQVGATMGALDTYDGRVGEWTRFTVGPRADCAACGPDADEPWMRV